MLKFNEDQLSSEDAFWVMWYFLQEHWKLSGGAFELSDILSACEPMDWSGEGIKRPADSAMVEYWNEAITKYREHGKPDWKELKK